MLLNMDCFGLRHASKNNSRSRQQYLTADINRALHIHQTSLSLSNDSQLVGGSQGKFLAVAEGVGQDERASRASTLAIDCLSKSLVNQHGAAVANATAESDIESRLVQLVQASQDSMVHEGRVIRSHRGMAARLGIAYVKWPNLYIVQVGSTRCLLLRNGWLTEWSAPIDDQDDHFVGGTDSTIDPFVCRVPLRLGDRLLMCSGSVADALSDFEIKTLMSHSETASEICEAVAAEAVLNGCSDCTLIVSCFDEGSTGLPPTKVAPRPTSAAVDRAARTPKPKQGISGKVDDVENGWAQRRAERPLAK